LYKQVEVVLENKNEKNIEKEKTQYTIESLSLSLFDGGDRANFIRGNEKWGQKGHKIS
jgi:hypothetical protein